MKTDLATSIVAAIIGAAVAYFVCSLFLPEIADVTFKVLDAETDTNYSLIAPDPEIFNYRAVDPTVEVYVGQNTSGTESTNTSTTPSTPTTPDVPVEDQPAVEDETNGASD